MLFDSCTNPTVQETLCNKDVSHLFRIFGSMTHQKERYQKRDVHGVLGLHSANLTSQALHDSDVILAGLPVAGVGEKVKPHLEFFVELKLTVVSAEIGTDVLGSWSPSQGL